MIIPCWTVVVGLAAAGLPSGDVLLADIALGQVRGPLLLGVEGPDATGLASLHDWWRDWMLSDWETDYLGQPCPFYMEVSGTCWTWLATQGLSVYSGHCWAREACTDWTDTANFPEHCHEHQQENFHVAYILTVAQDFIYSVPSRGGRGTEHKTHLIYNTVLTTVFKEIVKVISIIVYQI